MKNIAYVQLKPFEFVKVTPSGKEVKVRVMSTDQAEAEEFAKTVEVY